MSGIAGVVRFDGASVARDDLDRMANALGMYGPDRTGVVTAGEAGLVHLLMRFTPEDKFDRQPYRGASGALITADLRLDNRDDILARVGIGPQRAATWSDSMVVLAAWEKLGDSVWPMLRGPFAVAIWDPASRKLTLARDHLGLNVVMWHKTDRFFAFATMPKGLFALRDVPRELNEEKLADFLVLNHSEHETTFYRGVQRIAPAHVATISNDGSMSQRRYWSAADIHPVKLGSDEAYADAMRDVLDRAVRRQMRSAYPIGCHLSGGLDSSAVAAVAARALAEKGERLATYTHVPREGFDGPVPRGRYADETPYVEAIRAAVSNIDVNYVRNTGEDVFADLERLFLAMDSPVRNVLNVDWLLGIPRLARTQNRRVLLTGTSGNWTISWEGWPQAVDHLLAGRLVQAFRVWRLFNSLTPYSNFVAFRRMFIEPLIPDRVSDWAYRRRKGGRSPWRNYAAIRDTFADAKQVNARAHRVGHDFLYRWHPGSVASRVAGLSLVDYIGDWNTAEKAIHGVETRDPTADIDLVEFCLGVPDGQYLVEGIDRSLVRRAMWGLLPEMVLTNRLRGLQMPDWFEKVGRQREGIAAEIATLKTSGLANKSVDLERLERAVQTWPDGNWGKRQIAEEYHFALTRGLAVGRFARWFEASNR